MRRMILLLFASVVLGGMPVGAAVPPPHRAVATLNPADAAEIKALIGKIFGRYHHDRDDPLPETRIFVPSTLAIKAENARLIPPGEVGDIEADVFLDAQDNGEITVTSVTLAAAASSRVNAIVVFDDAENRIHGHVKRMTFERTPVGWRVYDIMLLGQGSYRMVMLRENARLSKGAAADPQRRAAPAVVTPPDPMQSFANGSFRFPAATADTCTTFYRTVVPAAMDATIHSDWPSQTRLLSSGSCGADIAYFLLGVSAHNRGFEQVALAYYSEAQRITRDRTGEPFLRCRTQPRGSCGGIDVPGNIGLLVNSTQRLLASGQVTADNGSAALTASYGDAPPPQAFLAPSYGRARILIEAGGRCAASDMLVRDYCFGRVIGYLRQHPDQAQTVAVTMTRSYLLGTWVPLNSGQGWNVYEVKRRGAGFYADRDRQFTTKVNPPQGCVPATVQDEGWYVTVSEGYKVANEAKHFLCDASRSSLALAHAPGQLPQSSASVTSYARAASTQQTNGPGNINNDSDYHTRQMMQQDDSGMIYGTPSGDARPSRSPHRKAVPHP